MNKTNPRTMKAQQELEAAREALDLAQKEIPAAELAFRAAQNNQVRHLDGRAAAEPGPQRAAFEAEQQEFVQACNEAAIALERALSRKQAAESRLALAERFAAEASAIEKAPKEPTSEEVESHLERDFAVKELAYEHLNEAQQRLSAIDAEISALEAQRVETLRSRNSVSALGATLASIAGSQEVLAVRREESIAEVNAAHAAYLATFPPIMSRYNSKAGALTRELESAGRRWAQVASSNPVGRAIALLSNPLLPSDPNPARQAAQWDERIKLISKMAEQVPAMISEIDQLCQDTEKRLEALVRR